MTVGQITGEIVKSAISLKIRSAFATTSGTPLATTYPTIYKEKVVQGMIKPCFFVWQMDVEQEKLMRNNYERVYQMNVRYHPEDNDLKRYQTLADIGNKLLEHLTHIEVPIFSGRYDNEGEPIEDRKPIRGSQMSFNIVDDVLQVFVTYVVKMKMVAAALPFMQQLFINSTGIDIPDSPVVGEYLTGTVLSSDNKQIAVNGKLIPQSNINYSLLMSESAVWDKIIPGDEIILLRSGEEYFALDTKDRNRLKPSIDGGKF